MTEASRPWNGSGIGDAGPYFDSQWHSVWRNVFGWGGQRANSGVFLASGTQPNDGLKVQAQGGNTSINVLIGAALLRGIFYISTTTVTFLIAANSSGNPRIDTVVLRADYTLRTIRLALKQGAPAASPVAATLTQTTGIMWEIPIADVAVADSFITITDANISPRHEWVNAPPGVYLDSVLNNSGATLNDGDVVVWDSTTDRAVTTTMTRDLKRIAGVWRGQAAASASGRIQTDGIGYVRSAAAVTRGDLLITSTTAGAVVSAGTAGAGNGVLGQALETTSGAGLVLARIRVRSVRDEDWVVVQDQKTSGTSGGTTAAGAWTTHVLNTEVVDTGNIASVASNQVTLEPGNYTAEWMMSAGANITGHRSRLRNITAGATLGLGIGANNAAMNGGLIQFTLTVQSAIELQYWANTAGANGLGLAVSTGDVEVYAVVKFTRLAETA
ncbi:MAG: hypothetical protein ABI690_13595 [Chloroflexota bacterium]